MLLLEWVSAAPAAAGLRSALLPDAEAMVEAIAPALYARFGGRFRLVRDPTLPKPACGCPTVPFPGTHPEDVVRLVGPGDLLWPVAPETDGILRRLVAAARRVGATVLASDDLTLALCGSKLRTARRLAAAGIATVPVMRADAARALRAGEAVLQPDAGAGGEGLRRLPAHRLPHPFPEGHILRPWLVGEHASLTLLCRDGRARLLACNRREVELTEAGLREEVVVGGAEALRPQLERLARAVAAALPGLLGPVGVDLLVHDGRPLVLEVNARVTAAWRGLVARDGAGPVALALACIGAVSEEPS